jgi:hypothetical protein
MSTQNAVMDRPYRPAISRDVAVLILFCLLGLMISLALFPRLDPDAAEFILQHLQ